jgi:predicted O-methyltransferase YrrM
MKRLLRRLIHRAMDGYVTSRAHDVDFQREMLSAASTARFIERYAPSAEAFRARDEIIRHAAALAKDQPGLVCEFGVYRGASINLLAQCLADRPVYGFDSFEGLPTRWRAGFERGSFGIAGGLPAVRANVSLIKGWFSQTLEPFLKSHAEPLALAHIDCDLYESTRTVLEALAPRIRPGTVLLFDEYFNYPGWQQHEHKAFREFVRSHGGEFAYVAYNTNHQQVVVRCIESLQ